MMKPSHLDMKRAACAALRRWAHERAKGAPLPPNAVVLKAGALVGVHSPGHLLEHLTEVVRACPEILPIESTTDE